jgi:hypothetical protein
MALQIDCGTHTQTSAHNLRQGFTQSCECLQRENATRLRLCLNPLACCRSQWRLPAAAIRFPAFSNPFSLPAPPPPPAAFYPPSVHAEDIVGRSGFSSYHRDQDRPRTEAAAKGQCNNPYVINQSASGGVMMLGPKSPDATAPRCWCAAGARERSPRALRRPRRRRHC